MNLLEYIESRNQEYEDFISKNPKEAIRVIESLKVEIGELTQRVSALQDALSDEMENPMLSPPFRKMGATNRAAKKP